MSEAARHRDARSWALRLWQDHAGPGTTLWRGLSVVTRTGWGLLAGAVVLLALASALGWGELRVAALTLAVVVAASLALVVGGSAPRMRVDLAPRRLSPPRHPGDPVPEALARITVTTRGHRPQRPVTLDVPVGEELARFAVPALGPGAEHTLELAVPGARRGVVLVGPVTTIRSDPFGVARRVVSSADPVELFVHPRTWPLPPLDAGLVRDLEGRATRDPSDADLDFHTLRTYAPGDDRRHVHWLSSARASAASGTTELMTKTYTDTRRSHLGIVLDGRLAGYGDEDLFEDAVSAAASVAARAAADDIDVTVVASDETIDRRGLVRTLDAFARVRPGTEGVVDLAARLAAVAPSTSIVLLASGPHVPFAEVRRAAALFPAGVRVVALRLDPGGRSRTSTASDLPVLTLARPDDLARLVAAGGL